MVPDDKKGQHVTFHSLAYLTLLRERMNNDPTYTASKLNEELTALAHTGAEAVKKAKK